MRKVFKVYINEKHYDVWDIPGREHAGWNDVPKTWWLFYANPAPTPPDQDSKDFVPFHKSISRGVWEVAFKQRTTTKYKWDELQFRGSTWCTLACNGQVVYEFGTNGGQDGMSFALARAQVLMVELGEHAYNFFDQEAERGRKVYYHGLPATVRPSGPGEIGIVPDYTCGLTKEGWWSELRRRQSKFGKLPDEWDRARDDGEDEDDDYINWGSALSDQHIDWFRK
jgi:hypothetical protein